MYAWLDDIGTASEILSEASKQDLEICRVDSKFFFSELWWLCIQSGYLSEWLLWLNFRVFVEHNCNHGFVFVVFVLSPHRCLRWLQLTSIDWLMVSNHFKYYWSRVVHKWRHHSSWLMTSFRFGWLLRTLLNTSDMLLFFIQLCKKINEEIIIMFTIRPSPQWSLSRWLCNGGGRRLEASRVALDTKSTWSRSGFWVFLKMVQRKRYTKRRRGDMTYMSWNKGCQKMQWKCSGFQILRSCMWKGGKMLHFWMEWNRANPEVVNV